MGVFTDPVANIISDLGSGKVEARADPERHSAHGDPE